MKQNIPYIIYIIQYKYNMPYAKYAIYNIHTSSKVGMGFV